MADSQVRQVEVPERLAESLMQVNKMLYKLPPEIGVARSRTLQVDFFQESNYTSGRTMVLTAQTGSALVDSMNSYFIFTIKTTGSLGSLGTGSSANVLNMVYVKTRSGKELSRLENANLYIKNMQRYSCSQDWFNTIGQAQGYPVANGNNSGNNSDNYTAGVRFVIPLWALAPCFHQDKLLPSQLMEGLRIEIKLENVATAFKLATVTDYTIEQPRIVWDTYDLEDIFRAKLQEVASSRGLNLLHKEVYHTSQALTSTSYNIDVNKAASKALNVFVVSRVTANIALNTADSFASEDYLYTKQSYHVGALYFPNAALETSNVDISGNVESYYNAQYAMDRVKACWNPNAVSHYSYQGGQPSTIPADNISGSDTISAASLNRSSVTDLAGLVLNNSRGLIIDLTFSTSVPRTLDVFLTHLRAVKQFIINCDVKD